MRILSLAGNLMHGGGEDPGHAGSSRQCSRGGPLGNHADQWSRWIRAHERVGSTRTNEPVGTNGHGSRDPPGAVPSGILSVWSSLTSVHIHLSKFVVCCVFRLDVPRNTGAKVRMEGYLYRILPGPSFLDRSWKGSDLLYHFDASLSVTRITGSRSTPRSWGP